MTTLIQFLVRLWDYVFQRLCRGRCGIMDNIFSDAGSSQPSKPFALAEEGI
uniref:Uncharacterized protein n=1 Tax=Meloidogyne enterolobii TaxID=390850 RepID=A0A6V7V9Q8_MELEN|nr:unnamed protein product [Meloidogyne enterolobii]